MKLMLLMALIGAAVMVVQSICSDINEEYKRYDNQDLIKEDEL